jgi:hypothetical protein
MQNSLYSNFPNFEKALSGGHPNSLGNTIDVVSEILNHPERINQLYNCYFSKDEVVRLRVSNAFKRIAKARPELVTPLLDNFILEVSKIDQASTRWTFAQLFLILDKFVTQKQKQQVVDILKNNLISQTDWIVLNTTMETLVFYSKTDQELKIWLEPQLDRLAKDHRKSVANRAGKYLKLI